MNNEIQAAYDAAKPNVQLQVWCALNTESVLEASQIIGINYKTLSSVRSGHTIPTQLVRDAIEGATGILASSWPEKQ